MVMDVKWTYCGDHFSVYTNIEWLCFMPETNILLYVSYTSIFKNIKLKYFLKDIS